MDQKRAIILLTDPISSEAHEKPLMLKAVLFSPVLTWVSEKLKADGVRRFFVACAPEFAQEARDCFRKEDDVLVSGRREDLLSFLEEDGPVAVIPGAVLPVGDDLQPEENCAFSAGARALRESWDGESGRVAGAVPLPGFASVESFQDVQELAGLCRDDAVDRLMAGGVAFLDRFAVYIGPRVEIGAGTVILPGTILRGETRIGTDCEIGPNTMIRDCQIGSGTTVNASQLNESTVGDHTNVGPFAYVRPNSHIGDSVKVGDFVEIKNSVIGSGTKISHLTYVGDSDVGQQVNFGCGTVTTNFDGFKKYRCVIGNHAFLGCNTNLIAPVTVGEGAYTAAGSTITQEVPADALAVARSRQKNLEGWAAKRRALHAQEEARKETKR